MKPADMTPAQIDTELARLWEAAAKLRLNLRNNEKLAERAADYAEAHGAEMARLRFGDLDAEHAEIEGKLSANRAEAEPFENEFTERGGWRRYFLVQNAGGHVHREMHCSTCYPTTVYGWLPELSDCDEAQMVAEYGATACTVCFPDAPTMPEWAQAEARKAEAKAADRCPGSGKPSSTPVDYRKAYPMGTCPECGERFGAKNGKMPRHKSEAMKAAEADAKRLAKNEAAGRCRESGRAHVTEREAREWRYGQEPRIACECGKTVKVTSNGKIPAHKAPKA